MNGKNSTRTDRPQVLRRLILVLSVACLLLQGTDLLYHRHVHFEFESAFGFFGWLGLLSAGSFLLTAACVRRLLRREEDYYDS